MKIKIPFVYQSDVIRKRCQKPTKGLIEDSVTVEIKEYENLPVGIKVGNTNFYWNGEALYVPDRKYNFNKGKYETIKTLASDFKRCAENPKNDDDYSESETDFQTGFYVFSKYFKYEKEEIYSSKEELEKEIREYGSDNKEETISKIKEVAEEFIFNNGLLYVKEREPRYEILTCGLGNNHGGTSLDIDYTFNSNIPLSCYYSALEYDLAIKEAIEFATRRKDTNSIKRIENVEKIEVLIPESVQIDMTKKLNRIYIRDLSPFDLVKMTEEEFKDFINKKYFKDYSRKIEILDFETNYEGREGFTVKILNSKRV